MDQITSRRQGNGVLVDPTAAHQNELDECLRAAVELHQQGHFDAAKQLYLALLSAQPDHFDATRLLGMMADQLGQSSIACDLLGRAVAQEPANVEVLYHYGLALQNAQRPDVAAGIYAQAFVLAPNDSRLAENLAVALVDSGREDSALDICRRALELDDTSAIAHSNLGTLYFNRGESRPARHHLERLVQLRPALAQAHEKLSTVYLRAGEYPHAWPLYDWRFANNTFLTRNPVCLGAYPTWSGEDLAGCTILVTPEQGVGDEIMFASCFADLIDRAGHVIIGCDERLRDLFARSFPAATVIGRAEPPSSLHIDCCVSAGSLPGFFRASSDEFSGQAYLTPSPERIAYWRAELTRLGRERWVGISWRAGLEARAQRARSVELSQWQSIFGVSNTRFVDLQYGDHGAELERCANAGLSIPTSLPSIDPLTNLDEFAALLVALNLVVTVDNSTAHLAGALGVPTWVMLPAGAEWRWGEHGTRAHWYESTRLYRQLPEAPGDWQPVVNEVANDLEKAELTCCAPAEPIGTVASPISRQGALAGRAVLLNDTRNWYHFGCTGTSLALHHQLRNRYRDVLGIPITDTMNLPGVPTTLAGFHDSGVADAFCAAHVPLVEALAGADQVYLNGEGTLHGRSPAACGLLYLAWLTATRWNTPVSIVNHSAYPGDDEGHAIYGAVYRAMTSVAIREPLSARAMRKLGIDVTDAFDSLPLYINDLYRPTQSSVPPYAVLAGGVTWHETAASALEPMIRQLRAADLDIVVLLGARAYPAGEELRFAEAVLLEHGKHVRLVHARTEHQWLDTIGGADLLVSGRFHHSIAAAFLGTPLVASGSNTPKITGLMDACQLPGPVRGPRDWTGEDTQRFAADLCTRVGIALADPATLTLTDDVRERLLTLARANTVATNDLT